MGITRLDIISARRDQTRFEEVVEVQHNGVFDFVQTIPSCADRISPSGRTRLVKVCGGKHFQVRTSVLLGFNCIFSFHRVYIIWGLVRCCDLDRFNEP